MVYWVNIGESYINLYYYILIIGVEIELFRKNGFFMFFFDDLEDKCLNNIVDDDKLCNCRYSLYKCDKWFVFYLKVYR